MSWPNEQVDGWTAGISLCSGLLCQYNKEFKSFISRSRSDYFPSLFAKARTFSFDAMIVDDLYNPCGLLMAGMKSSLFVFFQYFFKFLESNLVLWSQTTMRPESAWANQSPSPPSYLPAPKTGSDNFKSDEMRFMYRIA